MSPRAKDSGGENKDLYITTVDKETINDNKKAFSICNCFLRIKNSITMEIVDNIIGIIFIDTDPKNNITKAVK